MGRGGNAQRRRLARWVVGTIAGAGCATAPLAQPAADATGAGPITITGARDTQDIRTTHIATGALGDLRNVETPFSATTLTRQLLDLQQAVTYNDFLKNDPSATFGNVPVGFASLRGFAVAPDGYLHDGLPGAVGLSDGRYQLEGVDRIDVLKGPAVFLYGLGASTSIGGTLNFVPKRPIEAPVREASLSSISRSVFGAAVDLGDRFGTDRQFGWRLNLGYKNGEQAPRHADWNHKAAALAVDWRVAPGVVLSGGYEYAHNHFPELQPFYALAPDVTTVPDAPKGRRNVAQPWDDFKVIGRTAYVRADWQIAPDWSLEVQGLRGADDRPDVKEARFGFINDSAGNTLLFASEDASRTLAKTVQAALRGRFATGFVSHRLTFTATGTRDRTSFGSTALDPSAIPTNLYDPVDAAEPADVAVTIPRGALNKGYSLLVTDIVEFAPQWSALVGVRRAHQRNGDDTLDKTQPVGALMWKPTDASLVYVNYGEGVEQGGTVTPTGTGRLPAVVTRSAEIGAKLEAARMTYAVAAFNLRRPLETFDATLGRNVQRGEQRHRGVELTAQGQLTTDLALIAGTMLLDPKARATGNPATDGNRPAGVPKHTANVFADWRVAGGLFVNGGVYFADKQYLDLANTQRVPSWTRFDVGARWETRIGGVRTQFLAGIENVGGRDYWSGAQSGLLTLAEPRTYKLTARVAL